MHRSRPRFAGATFAVAVALGLTLLAGPATAATHVVDAQGGGDFTSLEAAVAAAASGDLIQVMPGTYPTSVTIEASLTITGLGDAESVVLDGQGSRIMLLQGEETIRLENLTFTGGYGDSGGAILSWQGMDLVIESCRFVDNEAGWGGGAIEARSATGSLTVRETLFEDNYATNHAGAVAVMFDIACEIDRCRFVFNRGGAMAGAFTANAAGSVDIHDSVFTQNTGGDMGAIYLVDSYTNTIRNCTFWNNVAVGHATVLLHHGVLDLHHNIIGNTAFGGGVEVFYSGLLTSGCNVYWNNDGGDLIEAQPGEDDWFEDPQLCAPGAGDFAPCNESIAVVGTGCGLIGALAPGCPCGVVRTEAHDWSEIKALFR
ncbi:hypothetical protein GF314_17600 [bacterium]|nr:hypothetical protein [bacterium]